MRSGGSTPKPGTSLIKIIRLPQVGQFELLVFWPCMNIAELPVLLKPGPTELRSGVQVGGKQNSPFWGEIVTDRIPHRASRIEFAPRITRSSRALGQAGWPPHPPTTPG